MTDDAKPTVEVCRYVGHDEDGNPEGCDKEASVVVRRKNPLTSPSGHMDPQKPLFVQNTPATSRLTTFRLSGKSAGA